MIRKSLLVTGLVIVSAVSFAAQPSRRSPALPANLSKYIDEYPVKLMKVPAVKARLKTLLGKRYGDFDISIAVQSPMTKVGDFLLASGCMPHVCTINEAAFAIDLVNKRLHAVIYEKENPPLYFNEDKKPTPQVLKDWVSGHEQ
ncbi:MAG: hypothetical protein DMF62_16895 [Acidobacteria bacterium]|nr:MAG: hypothetical protein DMF62_16895 [Acidobacteriota bacterium]